MRSRRNPLGIDNFYRDENGNLAPSWYNFCWLFSASCDATILRDEIKTDHDIYNKVTGVNGYDAFRAAYGDANAEIAKQKVADLEQVNFLYDGVRYGTLPLSALGPELEGDVLSNGAEQALGPMRDKNNRQIKDLLAGAGLSGIQPYPPN